MFKVDSNDSREATATMATTEHCLLTMLTIKRPERYQ